MVLFVDFVKPLRFPANLVNWLILNMAVFTPYVREGYGKHREWERSFHGSKMRFRRKGSISYALAAKPAQRSERFGADMVLDAFRVAARGFGADPQGKQECFHHPVAVAGSPASCRPLSVKDTPL